MQLAPGTCVATAKAVVKTKNIRGEREEDKGQSELVMRKVLLFLAPRRLHQI